MEADWMEYSSSTLEHVAVTDDDRRLINSSCLKMKKAKTKTKKQRPPPQKKKKKTVWYRVFEYSNQCNLNNNRYLSVYETLTCLALFGMFLNNNSGNKLFLDCCLSTIQHMFFMGGI